MSGSKWIIGIWVGALFVCALAFKLFETWMVRGSEYASSAFETFMDVVILFSVTGVVPMIWWAFRGFRISRMRAPLIVWSIFSVLMGAGGIVALNFLF